MDSGYPNSQGFIAPYRATTYHIPEFRRRRRGLCRKEEVFNYTHSSLRTCVERTFGVLKRRFKILKTAPEYPMNKQVMIPVACAVIHNFIRLNNPNDRLMRRFNKDGHTSREVDPRAVRVRDDGDDSVPNEFIEPNIAAGEDYMAKVRDNMADQMWRAFQQNPWYR